MTPFDSLLAWLGPDRERAALKYEQIRQRLIRIFACRGCPDADVLADQTIERVTQLLPRIAADYAGDPAPYFYEVAKKIFLESQRKRPPASFVAPPKADSEEVERDHACLERCMEELAAGEGELMVEYYRYDRRAKIEHRRGLAENLDITPNALRIRAHRIRAALQRCVQACVEGARTA